MTLRISASTVAASSAKRSGVIASGVLLARLARVRGAVAISRSPPTAPSPAASQSVEVVAHRRAQPQRIGAGVDRRGRSLRVLAEDLRVGDERVVADAVAALAAALRLRPPVP